MRASQGCWWRRIKETYIRAVVEIHIQWTMVQIGKVVRMDEEEEDIHLTPVSAR
jgi:hypothetical protein